VFAYDFVEQLEQLPPAREDRHDFADYLFWLPEELVLIDHATGTTRAIAHVFDVGRDAEARAEQRAEHLADRVSAAGGAAPPPSSGAGPGGGVEVDLDDLEFADLVERLKRHVIAGDVFQIVPSRTFRAPCGDPAAAYRELRRLNPSPYMFCFRWDGTALIGASPETCVKVAGDPPQVTIKPIAGTRPRGRTPSGDPEEEADRRLEAELKLDGKELAEHMMLVDLARNDVARISRSGTRRVVRLLEVERYSHVMHLVSTVEGILREDLDALHAYLASANMGTLVGAPKIEAARLLRSCEADRRGPYGGAVGYLTSAGEMDTAIVIRAALIRDGTAHVRAGAGVVFDSDPLAEAAETRVKAQAVLEAVVRTTPEVGP
jgi:anthranilate synthase component 1